MAKKKTKFKVGGDVIVINIFSVISYILVWVMAGVGVLNHFLNPEIVPLPETITPPVISRSEGKFPSLWAGDGSNSSLPDVELITAEEAFEWFLGEMNAAINNKGLVIEGTGYNVVVNTMGPMGYYQYQKTIMDKYGSIQLINGVYDETPASSPAKSYAVSQFKHKTMVDNTIVLKESYSKPNKVRVGSIDILDMPLNKMASQTVAKNTSNELKPFEFDLDTSKFNNMELKAERMQGILLGYTLSFNVNYSGIGIYVAGAKAATESGGYRVDSINLKKFNIEVKLYNYGGLKSISYRIAYDMNLSNIPVLGRTTVQNSSDVDMFFSYPKETIKIELP